MGQLEPNIIQNGLECVQRQDKCSRKKFRSANNALPTRTKEITYTVRKIKYVPETSQKYYPKAVLYHQIRLPILSKKRNTDIYSNIIVTHKHCQYKTVLNYIFYLISSISLQNAILPYFRFFSLLMCI